MSAVALRGLATALGVEPATEPRPRIERPLRITVVPPENGGGLAWSCRPCLERDRAPHRVSGEAATVGDAVSAALEHQRTDCPAYAEGARRLLEAVFLVPDYRPCVTSVPSLPCWICSRCGDGDSARSESHVSDRDAHTAEHLAGTVFA